jgi:hypothetical protein
MVLSVVRNFQHALKYRGGWRGLLEHMYTVSLNCDCFDRLSCEISKIVRLFQQQ